MTEIEEKAFVNNSTPTIQEEVITLRIENAELKAQIEIQYAENQTLGNNNFELLKKLGTYNEQVEELKEQIKLIESVSDANADENAELKRDKEYLDKVNNEQTEVILKLNEQIEKMKCCYNCSKWNEGQCKDIKDSYFYTMADFNCDKWELAE